MINLRKVLSVILSVVMLLTVFAGCNKSNKSEDVVNDNNVNNEQESNDNQNNNKDENDNEEKEEVVLDYWVPMHGNAVSIIKNYNENEIYQEVQNRLGIKIKFIHPAVGQEKEQFNLIVASKNFPDIIQGASYPGGFDKAVNNKHYLRLNELIDKCAPNFKKIVDNNDEFKRDLYTNEGNIVCFPVYSIEKERPWAGPVIRKDWLDELGLETPTTIDDWDKVLRAFKDKGVKAPMYFSYNWLYKSCCPIVGAYGIGTGFYCKDGKIKFGPIEKEYKDFLNQMHTWYKDGLIDKDFSTRDAQSVDALITNDNVGIFLEAFGRIENYAMLKKDDPNFKLEAIPYPTLNKGEKVHFRESNNYYDGAETVISCNCKYPEEAVKFLDYGYSDEGSLLYNFGTENKSYVMKDGKPQFTDLMLNNPDGLSFYVLSWKYKVHSGPYKRYPNGGNDNYTDIVNKCHEEWTKADDDYILPRIKRNEKDEKQYNKLYTQINTFIDEMNLKFITGAESIDNFDKFVDRVNKMGIKELIEIQQRAYDSYITR